MKRKSIIIISTVVGLAICVSAIAAIPAEKKNATELMGEIPVKPVAVAVNVAIAPVKMSSFSRTVRVTGITTASTDITYAAETAGRLEYMGAEPGDEVKQGKVLARVDYTTQRARQMQAQASYELAEATHKRMATLGADLISGQKLDEARFNLLGAKANLELATAKASNAVVRANGRGKVAAKFVEAGEFVSPGTPLYRVVDTRTIIVDAAIPESQVDAIRTGTTVSVRIDALSVDATGTVRAVIPKADPASRTFTVRVAVNNPDGRILVGMSASLRITTTTLQNVLEVPQDLVIEGVSERYVFVVENGIAQKRSVVLGDVDRDNVIVTTGLTANDSVVTFGHRNLSDGQRVNIVSAPLVN